MNVDLPQPLAPIQATAISPAKLHGPPEKRGLAPNCMAMPEATITLRFRELEKLAVASLDGTNCEGAL